MIAVTRGPVKLVKSRGWNDMGHYFPSEYTVIGSGWFYMELHDYMQKREFEHFNMKLDKFDRKEVDELIDRIKRNELELDFVECIGKPLLGHVYSMQHHIKRAGGQLWQYNVVSKDLKNWQREMSALGNAHSKYANPIRLLTNFERYVKIPILERVCRVLNRLHRSTQMKEMREWERKTKEFFDKKKEEKK